MAEALELNIGVIGVIGVTASQLTSQAGQLSLFASDADERQQRIDLAMDAIVERFGPQAAHLGGAGWQTTQ